MFQLKNILSLCTMLRFKFPFLVSLMLTKGALLQPFPYRLSMDSIVIAEIGGIQSFSFGQANGKWLIIGGRLDGLHRRQPWASFDIAGNNNQLVVIDPVEQKKWSCGLTSLDSSLREQLSSTNMQFIQRDGILYLMGGYGRSNTMDDHITFPNLTTVDVAGVIDAVIEKKDLKPYFCQVSDERFALTGGQLLFLDNDFYLIGGHRFEGRYNPMNQPSFEQTYSNSVHRFSIKLNGLVPEITPMPSFTEETLMHRRDFNVAPVIQATGEQGIIAFSGVFQKSLDIPYLNAISIGNNGMQPIPEFAQYYNHYHCANVSLHDPQNNTSHFLFFGGIAQYYDSAGILVQDNEVPFTQTIGHVVQHPHGKLEEFAHPLKMPGYLGAASEFIPSPDLFQHSNEVVDMSKFITRDSLLIGYIFGGIRSTAPNIFWTHEGTESTASALIYPVYLIRSETGSGARQNPHSTNGLQLQVFPDAVEDKIYYNFNLKEGSEVRASLVAPNGEIVKSKRWKKIPSGTHTKILKYRKLERETKFILILSIDGTEHQHWMNVH